MRTLLLVTFLLVPLAVAAPASAVERPGQARRRSRPRPGAGALTPAGDLAFAWTELAAWNAETGRLRAVVGRPRRPARGDTGRGGHDGRPRRRGRRHDAWRGPGRTASSSRRAASSADSRRRCAWTRTASLGRTRRRRERARRPRRRLADAYGASRSASGSPAEPGAPSRRSLSTPPPTRCRPRADARRRRPRRVGRRRAEGRDTVPRRLDRLAAAAAPTARRAHRRRRLGGAVAAWTGGDVDGIGRCRASVEPGRRVRGAEGHRRDALLARRPRAEGRAGRPPRARDARGVPRGLRARSSSTGRTDTRTLDAPRLLEADGVRRARRRRPGRRRGRRMELVRRGSRAAAGRRTAASCRPRPWCTSPTMVDPFPLGVAPDGTSRPRPRARLLGLRGPAGVAHRARHRGRAPRARALPARHVPEHHAEPARRGNPDAHRPHRHDVRRYEANWWGVGLDSGDRRDIVSRTGHLDVDWGVGNHTARRRALRRAAVRRLAQPRRSTTRPPIYVQQPYPPGLGDPARSICLRSSPSIDIDTPRPCRPAARAAPWPAAADHGAPTGERPHLAANGPLRASAVVRS